MYTILHWIKHYTIVATGGLASIYAAFVLLDGGYSTLFALTGVTLLTCAIYPVTLMVAWHSQLPQAFHRWTYRLGLTMGVLSGSLIMLNLPWFSSRIWFGGLVVSVIGFALGLAVWLNTKLESHDARRRGGQTIIVNGDPS